HDIGRVDPRVHIIMDLKCPDSGECAGNHRANLDLLKPTDQIKFVIASRRDFDWTADTIRAHRLSQRFTVLLSPAYGSVAPVQLTEWLLASGLHVRMQLQMHKYIWDPQARGVGAPLLKLRSARPGMHSLIRPRPCHGLAPPGVLTVSTVSKR